MAFSQGLKLSDLNDFISPSQACIKPVEVKKTNSSTSSQIRVTDTGNYYEVSKEGEETKLETAGITLNDCLACSGCITSAESVLVSMQSHNELYQILSQNKTAIEMNDPSKHKTIVLSLSPQSRASFAHDLGVSPQSIHARLTHFFKSFGIHYVFDISWAREIALMASEREFVQRWRRKYRDHEPVEKALPMLASSCPGFICYAEKTHAGLIPYISNSKSPQAVMGSIVKQYLSRRIGIPPERIYHISVMPCFDKKLEASRPDFFVEGLENVRETDCVISTGELQVLLREQNIDLRNLPEGPLEDEFTWKDPMTNTLLSHEGTSSGGYIQRNFQYAAKELFQVDISYEIMKKGGQVYCHMDQSLWNVEIQMGRNDDSWDMILKDGIGQEKLKFGICYGFRNIQNLVRKLIPTSSSMISRSSRRQQRSIGTNSNGSGSIRSHDFIEVMACPKGCINGGGQLKSQQELGMNANKLWVKQSEEVYQSVPSLKMNESVSPSPLSLLSPIHQVNQVIQEWLGGWESMECERILSTQYRGLEKKDEIEGSGSGSGSGGNIAIGLGTVW